MALARLGAFWRPTGSIHPLTGRIASTRKQVGLCIEPIDVANRLNAPTSTGVRPKKPLHARSGKGEHFPSTMSATKHVASRYCEQK